MKSLRSIIRDLRFVNFISPGALTFFVVEGIIEGATPFISIYLSALIINSIAAGVALEKLLMYALAAVALTLAAALGRAAARRMQEIRWLKMRHQLEMKVAKKMSTVDYSSLENPETHRLFRSLWEVENLESGFRRISNVFLPSVKGLSGMILAAVTAWRAFASSPVTGDSRFMAFICSPLCALLVVACILASVALNAWSSMGIFKATGVYLNKSRSFNNRLLYYTQKYVHGYMAGKDIRVYGQKDLIHEELDTLVRQKNRDNDHCENQSIVYQGASVLASGLLNLVAYVYVGIKALAGLFAVGDIVRYVGGIMQFTTGLLAFLDGYTQLKANGQFMEIYYQFFDLPNALHTGDAPLPKMDSYNVEFDNVSFGYPGTEEYVLKNFSCKLEHGKRHAIVGVNGSGKTTLIKLLCRLYDPQEGSIRLNGRDIREYDYEQYLELFSVVFQDFKLFPFALGNNVAVSTQYDVQKVSAALDKAGFAQRLSQLEAGCETTLYKDFDKNGLEVSGGEAQKIAIARAIYKDAPFVVLDEPTAALDPLSEQEIYLKFNDISHGKTTMYISHRLSSCKFCDDILVIDGGMLVQQGSHQSLLEQDGGKYHELWHAQAQHYVEK